MRARYTETGEQSSRRGGNGQDGGNGALAMLGGIGLGVAAMYFLDPARGTRRRAHVRDRVTHVVSLASDAADTTRRDLANRARGLVAETKARIAADDPADPVLVARVRTALGRVVSHPSSVIVTAHDGIITLSGPVLAAEVGKLLATVRRTRGVRGVENQLEVYAEAGNVPGLQGGDRRSGARFELFQENWAPATRLVSGALGGAFVAYGASRRGPAGLLLGAAGLALFARAASNTELEQLVGTGGRRRAMDLQKTINIHAPVEQVYDFFARYENFPRYMTHVRHVRGHGDGTAHCVVDGPAGLPITWDVELVRHVPGELVAWKTTPGSTFQSTGIVRFDRNPDGGTRVDIKMTHNPPGGALGRSILKLFGSDPKHQLDDDLARVKTFLETGKPAHDAYAMSHGSKSEERG